MNIRKYSGNISDRIAINANDVNVAAYIIYTNDLKLACYDEGGLRPINSEKLEDLYIKGILIADEGLLYTPTSLHTAEGVSTISYVKYDSVNEAVVHATITSSEEVTVLPTLFAMSIGNKTLTPSFDPEELAYTMATEDAEDILTLSVFPEDTEISVKLGNTELTDYAEGITWAIGENVLTITVGTDAPVVYTVTVTAS